MKTYSYAVLTSATERIAREQMNMAEKESDFATSAYHRGIAVGAWHLWQAVTAFTDEDSQRIGEIIGAQY